MPDLFMDVDVALAEVPVNIMPLLDDTDFKTREESVAYNASGLELIWHFTTTAGATTSTVVTPTTAGNYDWAHQDGGMYTIEITASGGASANNDTEGFGWFTGKATGVLPWRGPTIGFRAAALNNALIDGGDNLDVSLTHVMGTILTEGAGGRLAAAIIKLFDVVTPTLVASDVMRGTDGANTTTPPTVGQIQAEMEENGASLLDTIRDELANGTDGLSALKTLIDAIPTTAMRGTDSAALASVCTEARLSELDAGTAGKAANQIDIIETDTTSLNDTKIPDTISLANINAEADTALSDMFTSAAQLVDDIWDEVISKAAHNIAQSAAKISRQGGDLIQVDGSVSDATPTITNFDTDLTQVDDFFNNAIMVFSNGAANAGIGKLVSAYVNANGNMTFIASMAWPVTPVNGDDFVIVGLHAHPIAEIQSGLATAAALTSHDGKLDTVDTVVDGIQTDLANGTDGLGALKTLIDTVNTDLANGTDGLGALKTLIDALNDISVADILAGSPSASVGVPATVGELLYHIREFVKNKLEYVKATDTMNLYEDNGTTKKLSHSMTDNATEATRGAGT